MAFINFLKPKKGDAPLRLYIRMMENRKRPAPTAISPLR